MILPGLDVLLALRKVNNRIFGIQLNPNWSSLISDLKSSFFLLTAKWVMPLTPKFHIILEHIEEWIQMNGRSLGIESEQSGESMHHFCRLFLETMGEVKDKESRAHQEQVLWSMTKLNSDHK